MSFAALARALALSRVELVDASLVDAPADIRLVRPLVARGMADLTLAEALVAPLLSQVEALSQSAQALAAWIGSVGAAALVRQAGRPRLRRDPTVLRLAHAIDLDAVACLVDGLRPEHDNAFDWGVVPMLEDADLTLWSRYPAIDTHVHLGGMLPPLYYWVTLMGCEPRPAALRRLCERGGLEAPWEVWRDAVITAACHRVQLADWLMQRGAAVGPSGRRTFFARSCGAGDARSGTRCEVGAACSASWSGVEVGRATRRCHVGSESRLPAGWMARRRLVLGLSRSLRFTLGLGHRRFVDPLRDAETVRRSGYPTRHYAAGERWLLCACGEALAELADLEARSGRAAGDALGREERWFIATLVSYLKTKNAFGQLLAHEDGMPGLARFVTNFDRRGSVSSGLSRVAAIEFERMRVYDALVGHLVEPFDDGGAACRRGQRAVSVRVSPEAGRDMPHAMNALLRGVRLYHERFKSDVHQCGFIVHFLKRSTDRATPRQRLMHNTRTARSVMRVLRRRPRWQPFFVGVDAAGNERMSTPRVFTGAFDAVRVELDRWYQRGPHRLSMGFTYHVGEDCWDVLNGLRHIDETRCLLFRGRAHGRLGHALIMGEPAGRLDSRRAVLVPLGAHLLDLVWAIGRLESSNNVAPSARSLARGLRHRLDRVWRAHVASTLDAPCPPPTAADVDRCFAAMTLDVTASATGARCEPELLTELPLPMVIDRSALVRVHEDATWREVCEHLRVWLIEQCARQRVTIEANPSSNLLVGGYLDWCDLPYRPWTTGPERTRLRVTLNTDDPGLFMTSLPVEFARMSHAMTGVAGGRAVDEWLIERIEDARMSAFLAHVPGATEALELLRCPTHRPDRLGLL